MDLKDNDEKKNTLLLGIAFRGISSHLLYVEREMASGRNILTQGQWQIAWPAGQGPKWKKTKRCGTRGSAVDASGGAQSNMIEQKM